MDAAKTVALYGNELPFVARFLRDHDRYGYIEHIKVNDDHRGKGVGTRVVTRAIKTMQRRSCGAVLLVVDPFGNVPRLVRWYRRLGFRVLGRTCRKPTDGLGHFMRVLAGGMPSETFMGMRLEGGPVEKRKRERS